MYKPNHIIICLRNICLAIKAKKTTVTLTVVSKNLVQFLTFLEQERYIHFSIVNKKIIISLCYMTTGLSIMKLCYSFLAPSRYIYLSKNNLKKLKKKTGVYVIYTQNTYLTSDNALLQNKGGLLVCYFQ
jgi:ribosomal protein S8